eukprot:g14091.t1
MVILDDVGWASLRGFNNNANGKTQYSHTPNFDAARAAGITLKNVYVQPMCSPTRAAVMTGRYPHRYGSQTFVQRPFQPHFLKEDETTLADKLGDGGYITSLVGKWHLGYGLRKYTPTSRGFQRFFGSYEVGGCHWNHTVGPDTHALGALFTVAEGYQQTLDLHQETSNDGGKSMSSHRFVSDRRGQYSSAMFSEEAIREIDRAAALTPNKPLFLYLAYTTIHTPLQVPTKYIEMNRHLQGSDEVRMNAAMMSAMDDGYGQVVKALKRHRMWENTVVFIFSDNGGMITQGASNFPLRGLKMGPFEGGIRSAAMISGGHPEIVQNAGKISNTLIHAVDIHTLTLHFGQASQDYSRPGLPSKKLDAVSGKDLWASILKDATLEGNTNSSPRKEFIVLLDPLGNYPSLNRRAGFTLLGKCSAIRSGKWKLILGHPGRDDWYPVDPAKCFRKLAHEGTITGPPLKTPHCPRGDLRYDQIGYHNGFVPKDTWLFDIEHDPNEKHDLSMDYPEVVKRLKLRLDHEHNEAVDPLPDRWGSIMSMMAGNFAVLDPGGDYEAALGHWMEPVHLSKIGFFRKARAWIRITALDLMSKVFQPQFQVHREFTAGGTNYMDDNILSKKEREKISEAVQKAFGIQNRAGITSLHLEHIKHKLNLLELEYEVVADNLGQQRFSFEPPRSKM